MHGYTRSSTSKTWTIVNPGMWIRETATKFGDLRWKEDRRKEDAAGPWIPGWIGVHTRSDDNLVIKWNPDFAGSYSVSITPSLI
eukprot:7331376-Pyramimonas_sp.AAC.2